MQIKSEHRELFNEIMPKIDRKRYEYYIKNGEVRLYINYLVGDYWIMTYNAENNRMWVSYFGICSKFSSRFILTNSEIKEIISSLMEEHTKFNGVKIWF